MVIDDLDRMGVSVAPAEANAPLVVDSNAVLPSPISRHLLWPVPRGSPQISEVACRVENQQFPQGNSLGPGWESP